MVIGIITNQCRLQALSMEIGQSLLVSLRVCRFDIGLGQLKTTD
jgi:hypothetical protein